MNYEKAWELANKLNEYSQYEGSEIGEACNFLISGVSLISYVSDEFYQALCKEMKKQLDNFKTNSRIIKKKEIREIEYKELEWKGIDY